VTKALTFNWVIYDPDGDGEEVTYDMTLLKVKFKVPG
jgi:hypothetical protein